MLPWGMKQVVNDAGRPVARNETVLVRTVSGISRLSHYAFILELGENYSHLHAHLSVCLPALGVSLNEGFESNYHISLQFEGSRRACS